MVKSVEMLRKQCLTWITKRFVGMQRSGFINISLLSSSPVLRYRQIIKSVTCNMVLEGIPGMLVSAETTFFESPIDRLCIFKILCTRHVKIAQHQSRIHNVNAHPPKFFQAYFIIYKKTRSKYFQIP